MPLRHFVWLIGITFWIVACSAQSIHMIRNDQQTSPRDPRRARDLVVRGMKLMEENDYSQAQKIFEQAVAEDEFSGIARNNLGVTYYHQAMRYKAAWQFRKAAELLPLYPQPHNNLGLTLEAAGKIDQAVEQYAEAHALQPDDAQFLGNLVRARLRRGDKGPKMRELLTDLITKDTRPHWLEWANRQLTTFDTSPADR